MITDLHKNFLPFVGEQGLPEYYPVPQTSDSLLFYIQRNLNLNTVIYQLNLLPDGLINEEFPMHVSWIKYSEQGQVTELKFIQNKLAYGYHSEKICMDTYQFQMVSRKEHLFFITKIDNQYKVVTKINGSNAILSNIYVYADDVGLFPEVRYIEFYGNEITTNFPLYQKVNL